MTPTRYRHYKNKDYLYLGEAVHSETLEKLVVYETCYENALGHLWVRPSSLFFSDIEIDNKKRPRFAKVDCTVAVSTDCTPERLSSLTHLLDTVFSTQDIDGIVERLESANKVLLVQVLDRDRCVGFKLGYGRDSVTFYSWLGAVAPDYRRLGLGRKMADVQHGWCSENGFRQVETKTLETWPEMLALNLKMGFRICRLESSHRGQKIVLQKAL